MTVGVKVVKDVMSYYRCYIQQHRGDCSTQCHQSIITNVSAWDLVEACHLRCQASTRSHADTEHDARLGESLLVKEVLSQAGADALQLGYVVSQLFDGFHLLCQEVALDEVAKLCIFVGVSYAMKVEQ